MSRFSALRSRLLRHGRSHSQPSLPLPLQEQQHLRPFSLCSSLSSLMSPIRNSLPQITPSVPLFTLSIPAAASLSSSHSTGFRSFSSDSELPSNMVIVKSEDQLNDSLKKAEDGSSPSVFYFTATWCGPCRFIWPEIKKLSEHLPNVKFYKIDIDEVGSGPALSKLNISAVPTLHFFKDGKKAAEVVGADARKIKDVSSSLYQDDSANK